MTAAPASPCLSWPAASPWARWPSLDRAGRQISDEDARLLADFADHAAIALRNAEALEQSERSRHFAEAVAEVSRIVAHNHEFEHVAVAIADRARTLFGARAATVCRVDQTTGALIGVRVSRADHGSGLDVQPLVYPAGTGLNSVALRDGRALVSLDLLSDPRVSYTPQMRENVLRNRVGAMMAIPLMIKGRPVGTLGVLDIPGRAFGPGDVRLAEAFAAHAAMAVQRARVEEEARTVREFMQSVTENCADTIITTDVKGRITWVSPSAREMFGYAARRARRMAGGRALPWRPRRSARGHATLAGRGPRAQLRLDVPCARPAARSPSARRSRCCATATATSPAPSASSRT